MSSVNSRVAYDSKHSLVKKLLSFNFAGMCTDYRQHAALGEGTDFQGYS